MLKDYGCKVLDSNLRINVKMHLPTGTEKTCQKPQSGYRAFGPVSETKTSRCEEVVITQRLHTETSGQLICLTNTYIRPINTMLGGHLKHYGVLLHVIHKQRVS